MSVHRFMVGIAFLFLLIAGGLQLTPMRSLALEAPEAESPSSAPTLNFAMQAIRFDLKQLPDPVTPEPVTTPPRPPPDPAAGLKRYDYIGLAKSDARAAGVFEQDGVVSVVTVGSQLNGFTLTELSGGVARFVNNDSVEASLPLQTPSTP